MNYRYIRFFVCIKLLITNTLRLEIVHTFTTSSNKVVKRSNFPLSSSSDSIEGLREKAEKLRNEAREIRKGLSSDKFQSISEDAVIPKQQSPWNIDISNNKYDGVEYRLYVDIGREPGSWMDPRWGNSGQRIEFTVDIRFVTAVDDSLVDDTKRQMMVQDNLGSQRSRTMLLQSAKCARLRQGFVKMNCDAGAYRIDSNKGTSTVRFFIQTEGVGEDGLSFGDVYIPKGCLYFSLPVFGNITSLSQKDGPVSVRQMGWHTGWYREESRIVGVFKAKLIDIAKRKDGF
jgi:hypothetical protein